MIDIDITTNLDALGASTLEPTGGVVSGVRLLAQRVLVVFMTNISDILRYSEGSSFINGFGSSQVSTDYISLLVSSALADTRMVVINSTPEDSPSDEKLQNISIHDIQVQADKAIITLTVTSESGLSAQVNTGLGE